MGIVRREKNCLLFIFLLIKNLIKLIRWDKEATCHVFHWRKPVSIRFDFKLNSPVAVHPARLGFIKCRVRNYHFALFVGSSCWCHPICASTLISLCSHFLQRLIYFEKNHGKKFCLCSEVLWKLWALWSCPSVCTEREGTESRRGWLTEGVDWQSLPLLVELSASTSEQPKLTAITWFICPAVAAISQIRSKRAPTLCTAARYSHWKYFSVAGILHSIQVW